MEIKTVYPDYLLAEANDDLVRLGSFWGIGCSVGHQLGIIDCGLPQYGYGGVHLQDSTTIKTGDSVHLWGVDIGSVTQVQKYFVLFKCKPLAIYVDGILFRGFSMYLWLRKTVKMKLVPQEPLTPSTIPKHSKVELKIKPKPNSL